MNLQAALMSDPILATELLGILALAAYILRLALLSSPVLEPVGERSQAAPKQRTQLSLISTKKSAYASQSKLRYQDLKSLSRNQNGQKQRKNSELRPALVGNGVGRVLLLSERSLRPKAA